MIHPSTDLKFISDDIGVGLVATEFIPKGTITWALDSLDKVFTPEEVRSMDPISQNVINRYAYRNKDGNIVFVWDHGRFINHSYHPNCLSTPYNFVVAVRDIYPGDQLTEDYGMYNVSEPFVALPEPGVTRKCVMPDDLITYQDVWDAQLKPIFAHINSVSQPLGFLIDPRFEQKIKQVAAGQAEMDSIANCYYQPNKSLTVIPNKAKNTKIESSGGSQGTIANTRYC